ncbi:MAG: hypothetical protein HYS13_22395 [Planctomycetia bacterium]|nr:hypothetical protein [Planctomycetia bacterium]
MRLTLRTMLCYLDDLLEPADAKDIGSKIENSEFATNVVHRIRDVMRRPRLGAPTLVGRGGGLDPNTVAEYLDNALNMDRVADFEKVCLESDGHLAEVACCHQTLALVLGEPAEIETSARQRMYKLLARHDEEVQQARQGAPAARARRSDDGDGLAESASAREGAELPDYLAKQPSGTGWRIAVALVLFVVLGGVVVMAINPSWLRSMFGGGAMVAEGPATSGPSSTPSATPTTAKTQGTDKNGTDKAGPENGTSTPSAATPGETPGESQGTPAASTPAGAAPAGDPLTDKPELKPPVPEPLPAAGTSAEKPPPAQPAERAVMGKLVSPTPMFSSEAAGQPWRLLPVLGTVSPGDRLISPPTFRNSISLKSGVTVYLLSESEMALDLAEDGKTPRLDLRHGRIVVTTTSDLDTKFLVRVAGHDALVVLRDVAATLVVEARPQERRGVDPVAHPKPLVVDVYSAAGQITWEEAGRAHDLTAPARLTLGADGPVAEKAPAWMTSDLLRDIDKSAADVFNDELRRQAVEGRSLVRGLLELTDHRRPEVQALAIRSLAAVDVLEPLVAALNNKTQVGAWNAHLETLRLHVNLGSERAVQVKSAFESVRRSDGDELFRMLWGYSNEQLTMEGQAQKLVDYLEHPNLDFRVLAINCLRDITGTTGSYRLTATDQRSSVRSWKQKLDSGQIVHDEPAAKKQD